MEVNCLIHSLWGRYIEGLEFLFELDFVEWIDLNAQSMFVVLGTVVVGSVDIGTSHDRAACT